MLDKFACITLCNFFTLTIDIKQNDISKRYFKTIFQNDISKRYFKTIFQNDISKRLVKSFTISRFEN